MRRKLMWGLESAMRLSRCMRAGYPCGLLAILLLAAPAAHAQDSNAEMNDRFGNALAHGDFNSDGYQDLAIGVPFESRSVWPWAPIVGAGAVEVIYGTTTGLAPANRQFWRQGSGGVEDVAEAGDYFGWSLAAGDFNGDGFDDLAIGVVNESVGAIANAGAIHLIFGSALGLSTSAVPDQFWHQNTPYIEDVAEAGDVFGSSLSAGDFDSDGYDDLAIGVPGEDANAGAVSVLYGSATGFAIVGDRIFRQGGAIPSLSRPGDSFGWSLAAGNFDGDGYDDLAIGVPGEDWGAGAVIVMYGVASTGLEVLDAQFWNQDSAYVNDQAEDGDWFGASLAAGDFNHDGMTDLAIGIPYETLSALASAGAVHVLYGSAAADGLSATPVDQFWNQGNLLDQVEFGDLFGASLTVGDFNGDGYHDLAIGVPYEDVGGIQNAGAVNVLYGGNGGLMPGGTIVDQFWHQDGASVDGVAGENDVLGSSLAAGDFNGDGRDDLAIGVPNENLYGVHEALQDAGAVNVIYGSTSGLSTGRTGTPDQFWTQNVPLIVVPF